MALLRLQKTAEGVGATFPSDMLERMKVGAGDVLIIQHTADGILLTPGASEIDVEMNTARQIMDENAAVLRALAK